MGKPRMSKGKAGRSSSAEANRCHMQPACIVSYDFAQELCTFMKILAHALHRHRYVSVCLDGRQKCKSVGTYDAHIRKSCYILHGVLDIFFLFIQVL